MRVINSIIASAALAAMSITNVASAVQVDITPANMNGWSFEARQGDGSPGTALDGVGTLVPGPAIPPIGLGSANLLAVNGTGAVRIQNTFAGTPLSSINAMSYSTYVANNTGTVQAPYIQMVVDSDGNGVFDNALQFEPAYNGYTGTLNTWQNWNAFTGTWQDLVGGVDTTLAAFLGANPNAKLADSSAPGFRLTAGFGWAPNFDGNVDALTIGIGAVQTTYNFDVVPEPASLVMLPIAGLLLRRRQIH